MGHTVSPALEYSHLVPHVCRGLPHCGGPPLHNGREAVVQAQLMFADDHRKWPAVLQEHEAIEEYYQWKKEKASSGLRGLFFSKKKVQRRPLPGGHHVFRRGQAMSSSGQPQPLMMGGLYLRPNMG